MVNENKLAYKDMSNLAYFLGTFVLYSLTIFGSCIIDEPGTLFDWIGSITCNSLVFIMPPIFYLIARKKFAKKIQRSNVLPEDDMNQA